jgi:hypothetical protein
MRNVLLLLSLLVLAACEDDVLPTKPTAPVSAAKAKALPAIVITGSVDTVKASSICKASVRARGRALARLDETPSDGAEHQKATAFDALVSDACK